MSTKRRKKKKVNRYFTQKIFLIIQSLTSLIAVITLIASGMFPALYLVGAIIFLLLLLFLVYLLTVVMRPKRNKNGERRFVKRKVGYILSGCVSVFCVLGVLMLFKLMGTLSGMSDNNVVLETTAVYVLNDDPAESIDDMANYRYGFTPFYNDKNTDAIIEDINTKLDTSIETNSYDTPEELVAALYSGESSAIILNEAYTDIIEEIDGYEDFTEDTRIVFEHTEEVKTTENIDNENAVENIGKEPFIVYISGNDARTSGLTKGRSDVNILGVVNPETKQVLLVNTPRDYYVEISIAPGNYDKLTHCGIHGVQCSMDTLGNLYDCKVNYFAQINFNGFETLVDAVGGITVDIEKSFESSKKSSPDKIQYKFTEGEMKLDGAKALVYSRERKAFADGDLARGRHQMAVIKGLIKKMSSGAILTHYTGILDSLEGMCATNVSSDEMSDLVKMQLGDMAEWNIQSYAVTGDNARKTTYTSPNSTRYVMTQDEDKVNKAKELIQRVLDGETLTDEDLK